MASYPHVIRLRGPWELAPVGSSAPARRVDVPSDWKLALGADFAGKARYTRYFNRPTGLEAHERVWLCCEGARERGEIALNGRNLASITTERGAEIDITDLLALRNELAIEVSSAAANLPGGLTGEVWLEVRKVG